MIGRFVRKGAQQGVGVVVLQGGEFKAQRDLPGILADDQRLLRSKEAVNQAHRLRVMPFCQRSNDGGEGFTRRATW